jgi:hypothetical protein
VALAQLGIADAVRPKLVIKATIDGGAGLVAKGDADVAVQLPIEVHESSPSIRALPNH